MSVKAAGKASSNKIEGAVDVPQPELQPAPGKAPIPKARSRTDADRNDLPTAPSVPDAVPGAMSSPIEQRSTKAQRKHEKKERILPQPAENKEPKAKKRKRESEADLPPIGPTTNAGSQSPEKNQKLTLQQTVDHLAQAAQDNKPGAIDALRVFLDGHPGVHQHFGDSALAARAAYVNLLSDDSRFVRESVFKQSEALLKEYLPGEGHCPTERILAEQIVICHLRTNFFDFQSANHALSNNRKLCGLLMRKQEQSQNQLFKSITKFETFRRLKSKPE